MRNREAAQYARWAAFAAGSIALIVAGVYAERAYREARARRLAPVHVAATIEKQSHEFSFSKMDQERTIFTVRASDATEFKDQNRTVLKDVWITIYGRDASRNDNIHTRECSYDPKSGAILCEGDVQIDVAAANPPSGPPAQEQLEITTAHLSFNRETGEAATPSPVEFRFPQGQGHGVGVTYSTRDAVVRLDHDVQLTFASSDRTGGLPVNATGSNLAISRGNHTVVLGGPALVKQGDRELSAGKITIELDAEFHARHAVAEDHPAIHAAEGTGTLEVSANQFECFLNPDGWVQKIVADGSVMGTRQAAVGVDHFSTAHAELKMLPKHNLIENLTASGGVALNSRQGGDSRSLKTEALRVTFTPASAPELKRVEKSGLQQPGQQQIEQQRISAAETLGPGMIETKTGTEATTLNAKKFVAQFSADGRLQRLLGHSGTELRRQLGAGMAQTSKSAELAATFDKTGQWDTLDETESVRFQQNDRQATAAHARIIRSSDLATLDGSPILADSQSRTTAAAATINHRTGELHLTGGVVSTYFSSAQNDAVNIGSGPAHISAQTLSGSSTSGHVIYTGHARLWQGESVLDADQIEVWRDEKKLVALGHVVAVFPQASGQFGKPAGGMSASVHAGPAAPTLWNIRAPSLTYWSDQGKAHLEGGVTAQSQQGSLQSPTLDVFLSSSSSPSGPNAAGQGPTQLKRALALGGVTVRQGDRLGTSDQAEYTASDGKFVLSGGKPTLTDASSDTTTGHSLTFFVANDTILIDSQEGSRTLTKHRVEK